MVHMICPVLTVSQQVDGQNGARRLDRGAERWPARSERLQQRRQKRTSLFVANKVDLGIVPVKHNM